MKAGNLNADERRVFELACNATAWTPEPMRGRMRAIVLKRLIAGSSPNAYGPLDIANDTRDLCAEAGAEACDGIDYAAMEALRRGDAGLPTSRLIEAIDHFVKAWALLGGDAP